MEQYQIKPYKKGHEKAIHELVKRVYDEFVSKDYSEEGNCTFYDWIAADKIMKRQKEQVNILLAFIDFELVGMIEVRDDQHISLLFVDKKHQGKGIAKGLFQEALEVCIRRTPDLDRFYVHATLFSIPVYEKFGFIATAGMQEQFGIKYLPMEMKIVK